MCVYSVPVGFIRWCVSLARQHRSSETRFYFRNGTKEGTKRNQTNSLKRKRRKKPTDFDTTNLLLVELNTKEMSTLSQQTPLSPEEYHNLSAADSIRYRSAFGRPADPKTGKPSFAGDEFINEQQRLNLENRQNQLPTLLNRFDLLFFAIMFIGFGLLLKFQYKVDVTPIVWSFIKPSYDEGVNDYWSWDGQSPQAGGDERIGASDGDL